MERLVMVTKRYLFLKNPLRGGFLSLFISKRLIQGAAAALVGLFIPIYLYTLMGESFPGIGLLYAALSLGYALLLVPAARVMSSIGFRNALIIGGIFSVLQYLFLFFLNTENVWKLIGPLALSIVLFRLFHWVPYHVDFAVFTRNGERGSGVGLTYATIAFMGVVGPILAGYIIAQSGFHVLFGISVILLIAATISYSFIPKTQEQFVWSYRETWQKLFAPEHRSVALGMFANGAETVVSLIAWPIFLYEIFDGNFFEVGAISTIVTGATIIIQLMVGKYLDEKKASGKQTLRVGSALYAIGWIIKIFVLSATQVFFVGLYHNVTKVFTKTPFSTVFYDMSAEQGRYIDEFTVLSEIANHMGRCITLLLIAALTLFISIQWTFILGAAAALLLNAIYRTIQD